MKDQPDTTNKDAPDVAAPTEAPAAAPPTTQQWNQTPPASAQVQYVVAQKSLDGIGGWLAFWLVIFSIAGIGEIGIFFRVLSEGVVTASQTLSVIFTPVLAVGYLGSVVLIALRKKLGMWVSMASIGVQTIYSVIDVIISSSNPNYGSKVGAAIGGVITTIVFGGLLALYFYTSKRVKATLTSK